MVAWKIGNRFQIMLCDKYLRAFAAVVLFSSLVAGCAFGPPTYEQNIQAAVARGIIDVDVRLDGTVILSGWTEDEYSKNLAENTARQRNGITQVINLIYVVD